MSNLTSLFEIGVFYLILGAIILTGAIIIPVLDCLDWNSALLKTMPGLFFAQGIIGAGLIFVGIAITLYVIEIEKSMSPDKKSGP